jgi:chromosome segregation ATPase
MTRETISSADELDRLRAENDSLRARVEAAEQSLEAMRVESIERRAEVRALAEDLPAVMSRRAVLAGMLHEAAHHPDKPGVVKRAAAKLGRAPRKLARMLHLAS